MPHERLFNYQRICTNGIAALTWLLILGPALLKRHNRSNKYDALVQEVELSEANLNTLKLHPRMGEAVIATKYLAPAL